MTRPPDSPLFTDPSTPPPSRIEAWLPYLVCAVLALAIALLFADRILAWAVGVVEAAG